MMSIDQTDIVDFVTIDDTSGDLWLTISDHLPWDENEGPHLVLLQNKLNSYLRFIESGELLLKMPAAKERSIVINFVSKFSPNQKANYFMEKARATIEDAGFQLRFSLMQPN